MNRIRTLQSLCAALALSFSIGAAHADDAYTFKVKGIVKGLPGKGLAKNEILIKHEDIPEYRNESGEVVGMKAMTMPFYLNPGLSLDTISVGDPVELEVQQQINPEYSERVVAIKRAP